MSDALEITEAVVCVDRLTEHQRTHRLSDAAMVRAFPALGSARSWRRLAAQDWGDMPLDVWLPRLQEAVAQLNGSAGSPALDSQLSTLSSEAALVPFVTRHLHEADRCRREKHLPLARSHCRAARQAIENFSRSLS